MSSILLEFFQYFNRHFWTRTKIIVYENGTHLNQFKNKWWLREWHTSRPLRKMQRWKIQKKNGTRLNQYKKSSSTTMAHIWISLKTSGDYGNGTVLDQYKKSSTTEMAHFWTITKNHCLLEWNTFEYNLLDTKLVEYFIKFFSLYRYKDEKNSKKRTDWIIWSWGSCFIICFGSCRCCSRSCCCSCRLRDTTKLTFVWTKHFNNFSRAWIFIPTIFETNTILT